MCKNIFLLSNSYCLCYFLVSGTLLSFHSKILFLLGWWLKIRISSWKIERNSWFSLKIFQSTLNKFWQILEFLIVFQGYLFLRYMPKEIKYYRYGDRAPHKRELHESSSFYAFHLYYYYSSKQFSFSTYKTLIKYIFLVQIWFVECN